MTPPQSDFDIAFKALVLKHQEKVRNTCYHFVRNPEDADDLAQEVFVQVFKSLTEFREDSELSTWIYRIAVNKSLDFLRKKKRIKRFGWILSLDNPEEADQEIVLPADGDAQSEFETQERQQILHQAIQKLPENQRIAITLSNFEGFSNKEIAEIMNISLSAVEALNHRAKKNLHKKLYQYFKN